MKKQKINIIDSMCGTGKTTYMIHDTIKQYQEDGRKFIFITPYISEIKRVREFAIQKDVLVLEPYFKDGSTKLSDLKKLFAKGNNIATTHALFKNFDLEVIDIIRQNNYTLILDEVVDVVETVKITDDDLQLLKTEGFVHVEEDGLVTWNDGKNKDKYGDGNEYKGRFEDFRKLCLLGSVYQYKNSVFVYTFPISVFKAFKDVWILSYMFDAQVQYYYYQFHECEMTFYQMTKVDNKYKLINFTGNYDNDALKIKDLINIYEGKINFDATNLTTSYFEKASQEQLKILKNNITNYFRHITKSSSDEFLWTTLKSKKEKLKGNGYTKSFVELNLRATNDYRHTKNLAFVYDKHFNPLIKNFFIKRQVDVNEEKYALSELLQFIFRSRLRDSESINLYIPSARQRNILKNFLNIKK